MKTFQPIIKPVSLACNLNCSYCYYGPPRKEEFRPFFGNAVDKISVMSDETLRVLINAFATCDPLPEFIWHGGEPLLAGLDFFRRVVKFQNELLHGRPVTNTIQTNGTLITDTWAEFFSEQNFKIGVSLDGTPETHDAFRTNISRIGSAERAINGIKILQSWGINPSIICTVTKANVNKPKETYSFLRSLGITKLKFSHLHERERSGDRAEIAAHPEAYVDFLIAIMDAWIAEDNPNVEVAELHSIIQILTGGDQKDCIFSGVCDRYFTIEYDGSVSWCDTIAKAKEMRFFGNIRGGLETIVALPAFKKFQEELSVLHEQTKSESWYSFLSFGCIGDYPTLPLGNQEAKNTYAEAWMRLVREVADRLVYHGFPLKLNPK